MKQRKKRILAWLLTFAVVLSSQSVMVMAEPFSDTDSEAVYGKEGTEIIAEEPMQETEIQSEAPLSQPEEIQADGQEQSAYEPELKETAEDDTEVTEGNDETQDLSEETGEENPEELLTEEPVMENTETEENYIEDEEIFSDQAEKDIFTAGTEENEYIRSDVLLVDWTYHVDRFAYRYVPTEEHPEGEEIEMEVTGFTVTNENTDDPDPVCVIDHEDENGWEIRANRLGNAVLTLTYGNSPVENDVEKIQIVVQQDQYELQIFFPSDNNNMLRNSKKTATTVLYHNWCYNDEDQGRSEVEDWTLEFDENSEGWSYDKNLVDIKIDGHDIIITSGKGLGSTGILLRGKILDQDGSTKLLEGNITWVNVTEEYDAIQPDKLKEPEPGQSYDLNDLGLQVIHTDAGGETSVREDVVFEAEFDGNQWEILSQKENKLPVLKRKNGDDTWVNIIARDKEGNEVGRREYHFDRIDYDIWFNNLREVDYWTYLYENSDTELTLNTANLEGKNTKIQWEVGYRTEEDESGDVSFCTEIPSDFVFWNGKTDSIRINGTKYREACRWLSENPETENCWFEIRANAVSGDAVVSTAFAGLHRDMRTANKDYQYPTWGENMLPGETFNIGGTFYCFVEDEEHPYGEDIPVKITEIQAKGYSDREEISGANVYKLVKLSSGWQIQAKSIGHVDVVMKYQDLQGKIRTHEFTLQISDTVYWMECTPQDDINDIPVNCEKNVQVKVYYRDAHHRSGAEIAASDYSLQIPEEDNYDPQVLKSVNAENSGLKVIAGENGDCGTNIHIVADSLEKNEDDEPQWRAEGDIWLNVWWECDAWLRIRNPLVKTPEIGEAFQLKDYQPLVLKYNSEKNSWDEADTKNIRYRVEFYDLLWNCAEDIDEIEDHLNLKLTRIKGDETQIRIVARQRSEDSRYGERWDDVADTVININGVCEHSWKYVKTTKAATCTEKGTKTEKCTICGQTRTVPVAVNKNAHSWSAYKITKAATVFKAGTKVRTCSRCKKKEPTEITKLNAKITLAVSGISLQKGKSVTVKISGLQKGDSVKTITVPSKYKASLKAEKTKSGDLKLTAKKSSGTVKVTVTTAAKAKKTITVKLQNSAVKTTKITGVSSKLTIRKGKTAKLKPVRNPISSLEKITYQSSNKKIATVDSNGKIIGIRPGKAVITVKAGKAKVNCTVTVTK